MSETIIAIEKLSKRYLIEHSASAQGHKRYTALRDVIGQRIGNFARDALAAARGRQIFHSRELEEFWALKNVSFEVKRGEVLGIIGRNGAGKSTLLKILSRITEPTEGRVTLRGRVASLLEVGTGFHPELTGRENIYLNGAILGMNRAEIRRKFDEIVTFAEVERFLDTPVKRYSSGMYVRLAFAVAAHLEPEILVVDEVLAVGDIEFQRKCLGKMKDVASTQDRTVLFVSHNMAAIQGLCDSAILLTQGRCTLKDSVNNVVNQYLQEMNQSVITPLSERIDRAGSGQIRFASIALESKNKEQVAAFQCGMEATLRIGVDCLISRAHDVKLWAYIYNEIGHLVIILTSEAIETKITNLTLGSNIFRFTITRMPLIPGRYRLDLYAATNDEGSDWIENASVFDVENGDFYHTGHLPVGVFDGLFLVDYTLSFAKSTHADVSETNA